MGPNAMVQAVAALKRKGFSKANKVYKVPPSTLEYYVNHKSKDTVSHLLDLEENVHLEKILKNN